jgi:hypothetical protein
VKLPWDPTRKAHGMIEILLYLLAAIPMGVGVIVIIAAIRSIEVFRNEES